jgi:hypothetical protein
MSRTAIAEATESEPDFKLAYVLATASFYAYAVGELDDDHDRARAFECLRADAVVTCLLFRTLEWVGAQV